MIKRLFIFLFLSFIFSNCSPAPDATGVEGYLIQHIDIVSMDGPGVQKDRAVLIKGGKIAGIFGPEEMVSGQNYKVIDGSGKFLSPGLIDAHAHVSIRSDFERYIAHGVTTVREMWGLPVKLRWRDAIAKGQISGPNFIVSSTFFWLNGPAATMHVEPTDPETGRALVRKAKEEGYDLIKIVSLTDMETLKAVIDEAKKLGLRISGHYPDRSVPVEIMLDIGMNSFEHADEISSIAFKDDASDENIKKFARALVQRGIGITTILTPAQNYLEIDAKGKEFYTPEAKLEILLKLGPHYFTDASQTIDNVIAANGQYAQQWTEGIALAKRAAKIFMEEGVPLAIGTEGIGPFFRVAGVGTHSEMALLSSAGLSNYEVMGVATVNGAKVTGFEGQKGLVKEGYDADLLILSGNPLDDLSVLEDPEAVFVRGKYYSPEALAALEEIY